MATKRKSDGKKTDADRGDIGGGILGSLTGFLENLGDLAEAGERWCPDARCRAASGEQ